MQNKMLTKEELDKQEFVEKAGMINCYLCESCGNFVIYLYQASGTTPNKITCLKCGELMQSQFAEVKQPTLMWYRPKDDKALRVLAEEAYIHGVANHIDMGDMKFAVEKIYSQYVDHYNAGGLFATAIIAGGASV